MKEKVDIITADILLKCSLPLFVIKPLNTVSSENDMLNCITHEENKNSKKLSSNRYEFSYSKTNEKAR